MTSEQDTERLLKDLELVEEKIIVAKARLKVLICPGWCGSLMICNRCCVEDELKGLEIARDEIRQHLGLDQPLMADEVKSAIDEAIQHGWLEEATPGTYRITEAGQAHVESLMKKGPQHS